MARPLRLELAGGLYHVTSRGDGREDIYLSDTDRLAWLEIFTQVCQRFNWICHAWCQMDNHYHLLIETPEANLSQGMRQLNAYTPNISTAAMPGSGMFIKGAIKPSRWRISRANIQWRKLPSILMSITPRSAELYRCMKNYKRSDVVMKDLTAMFCNFVC